MVHEMDPSYCKVENPHLVPFPFRTPIIEWYVVRCGSKNRPLKDVLKEIELHAQNMITFKVQYSTYLGDLFDHAISMRILTLIMKIIMGTPQMIRKMASVWI